MASLVRVITGLRLQINLPVVVIRYPMTESNRRNLRVKQAFSH